MTRFVYAAGHANHSAISHPHGPEQFWNTSVKILRYEQFLSGSPSSIFLTACFSIHYSQCQQVASSHKQPRPNKILQHQHMLHLLSEARMFIFHISCRALTPASAVNLYDTLCVPMK